MCIHWQIILINKTPFFVLWLTEKDTWCSLQLRAAPTFCIQRPRWVTERLGEAPGDMLSLPRFTDQKYACSCYIQPHLLHGAGLTKGVSHMWLVTKFHFSSRHRHEDLQLLWFHKTPRPGFTEDCLPRINLLHVYTYWESQYTELLCSQITTTNNRQLISFKHFITICLPQDRQAALFKKFFLLLR